MRYPILLLMILGSSRSLYCMVPLAKRNKASGAEITLTPQANLARGEHSLLEDDLVKRDYGQARDYFEKAVEQEEDQAVKAKAALHLGMLYYFKQGVAEDPQKMDQYLSMAAMSAYWIDGLEEIVSLVQILKEPQPYDIHRVNELGESPLHGASKKGYLQVVELLFRLGADAIIEKRVSGRTALFLAATCGHEHVIKRLLSRGAEIDVRDSLGWTPLRAAAVYYHKATLETLLQKGADLRIEDDWGHTPFYSLAKRGMCDLAAIFLDHGAYIDEVDDFGWTALHWVAKEGMCDMAALLIERGARVNAISHRSGDSPLHIASMYHQKGVVRILREHGALRDLRNNKGKVPKECSLLDALSARQVDEEEDAEELSPSL